MEAIEGALIGTLSGGVIFFYFYKEHIRQEKKLLYLIKLLKQMDEKTEGRIWGKIDSIEEEIGKIQISLATLKVKIAYISGGFSFAGALIFAIVNKFVFKT